MQLSLFDDRRRDSEPRSPRTRSVPQSDLGGPTGSARQELLAAKRPEDCIDANVFPSKERTGIALRVGKVLNRYQVGKHLSPGDRGGVLRLPAPAGAYRPALDGIYVIRTSVAPENGCPTNSAYKGLSVAERA